jgi:hypothetical protein
MEEYNSAKLNVHVSAQWGTFSGSWREWTWGRESDSRGLNSKELNRMRLLKYLRRGNKPKGGI